MPKDFWTRIEKTDSCWIWTGWRDAYGYGCLQQNHRKYKAHRVAYELVIGPIPQGLVIDHLCRNRACCNPEHMEPVTNRENILRGVGASARNAKSQTCPQGHAYDAIWSDGGRHCKTCHRERMRRVRSEHKWLKSQTS